MMDRYDIALKGVVSVGGATVSYLYGGWSALLGILLVFVVLDYITGIMAAGIEGKLKSSVGLKGIARKVFIFVMVAIAHLVDQSLGDAHMFRDMTIFFYLANELISILENGGRIGVPIPPGLEQAIEILKKKGDRNE